MAVCRIAVRNISSRELRSSARQLSNPSSRSLINDQDVTGSTPLHYSATLGHEAVTKQLFAGRCQVDIQDTNGDTTLHLAANRGHGAVTKLLISAGCNVNLTEKHGATPLHVVAAFGGKNLREGHVTARCTSLHRAVT
jgi:ankyrin repeat protein